MNDLSVHPQSTFMCSKQTMNENAVNFSHPGYNSGSEFCKNFKNSFVASLGPSLCSFIGDLDEIFGIPFSSFIVLNDDTKPPVRGEITFSGNLVNPLP